MKLLRLFIVFILMLLTGASAYVPFANASTDPLLRTNNKYGIHILNESDIEDATSLVNSSGGDWGYVTLVIQDDDRKKEKWQTIFNSLRERHLIPIVRIATHGQGTTWVKPSVGEAPGWASFLNSLNWVVKNRYVVIFNEPNHASEWEGVVSPSEYADVLTAYATALKQENLNFFILNAGFDASASNSTTTMDEGDYLSGMLFHNPHVFNVLDGWSSHSYPNPDFSSSPQKTGRGGIRGYLWEIETLKQHNINRHFPIFITETGWNQKTLDEDLVATYYQQAFQNVWGDTNVVAITPFVLDYQSEPFARFSWKKGDGYAKQYEIVQTLRKIKGDPEQLHKLTIKEGISDKLIANSTYLLNITIENTGESIWDQNDGYFLSTESNGIQTTLVPSPLQQVVPFQTYTIALKIKTPDASGIYPLQIYLNKNDQRVGEPITQSITVLKPEVEGAKTEAVPPYKTTSYKTFWDFLFHPFKVLGFIVQNRLEQI